MRAHLKRGFTLIELLLAVTILAIVTALAGSIVVAAVFLSRNAQSVADANDVARIAGDNIAAAIRSAGLYAPGGMYVWTAASPPPSLIYPVFGLDGTTGNGGGVLTVDGSDDLWVVVPDPNALRQSCSAPGGQVSLLASVPIGSPAGPLAVNCPVSLNPGVFNVGDILVVSNASNPQGIYKTGALLTSSGFGMSGNWASISYAQQGNGTLFSDSPPGSQGAIGFQRGDVVYRASVIHYFVGPNPNLPPPNTNRKGLYMQYGTLTTDTTGDALTGGAATNRPFSDPATAPILVANFVEDLQVAYGFDTAGNGDPSAYVWQYGCLPGYANGPNPLFTTTTGGAVPVAVQGSLRSIRISVVSTSLQTQLDTNATGTLADTMLAPQTVENHCFGAAPCAAAVPDGYWRTVYTKRVELPNVAIANL